jgi:transcription elongation factor GreA-like protein
MKTLTLAALYETQGHLEDALNIYKEILEKDPKNKKAIEGFKRLSSNIKQYKSFDGVNQKMKNYFVKMREEEHFDKFERWLARSWN